MRQMPQDAFLVIAIVDSVDSPSIYILPGNTQRVSPFETETSGRFRAAYRTPCKVVCENPENNSRHWAFA